MNFHKSDQFFPNKSPQTFCSICDRLKTKKLARKGIFPSNCPFGQVEHSFDSSAETFLPEADKFHSISENKGNQ